MTKFIDLHCHLLPNIDDGPATLADSVALAQALVSQGFTTVVATPHYIEDYSALYQQHIIQQFNALQAALQEAAIPLTLLLGGEMLLTPQILKIPEATLPVISGTKLVLLELPLTQAMPHYTQHVMFTLQLRGFQPVLAHPERVQAFQEDMQPLLDLLPGCLLQINIASLLGHHGKRAQKTAMTLCQVQAPHFLATDSHRASQVQKFNIPTLTTHYPVQLLLHENPQLALRNQPVKKIPKSLTGSYKEKLFRLFKRK
ncbi:MAG: hypothetical protein NUK65_01000 [Firmicutes bacterium]|nr:hypothetical protein [Bacillota bacterium]